MAKKNNVADSSKKSRAGPIPHTAILYQLLLMVARHAAAGLRDKQPEKDQSDAPTKVGRKV